MGSTQSCGLPPDLLGFPFSERGAKSKSGSKLESSKGSLLPIAY